MSKILKHAVPPGYRRNGPPARPKLDPFIPLINQILEEDKSRLKKQRHTSKRIYERLRDEHGFTGGITIVTDYVREKKRRTREVFVPLSHAPGHAQVDFGEALGEIGGVVRKQPRPEICSRRVLGDAVEVIIPPPKNAVLALKSRDDPSLRDQHIAQIQTYGRLAWQVRSGYNQRSRAEAQIGRWKSVIGPKLRSRRFENQKTEAQIGVRALNRMTELGCARFESVG